jgi:hypothetical protein
MPPTPIHHVVRIRTAADLNYIRPGLMDEVVVNANLLENCPESTAAALQLTTLPYSIDPLLTRFQVPDWWRNDKGETKRNYARLGARYVRGTNIEIASGPLRETVPTSHEWRTLGRNVIEYQQDRLLELRPQMQMFGPELRPVRFMAPALVAFSGVEDRINRELAESSAEKAGVPIRLPVVVPESRLRVDDEVDRIIATLLTTGIESYLIWTPWITEDLLLADSDLLASLVRLVSRLADTGISVGHLHATYLVAAMHGIGIDTLVHHMGWVDKGEPADQPGGGLRSCQTYVPGLRRPLRFSRARELGRPLDGAEYVDRYCTCAFCIGSFDAGQHPLDLLLEDQAIEFKTGRMQLTPTGRAVGLNTWHYLLSRRQEAEAFSTRPSTVVVQEDIERAARLAGRAEGDRLRRIAGTL